MVNEIGEAKKTYSAVFPALSLLRVDHKAQNKEAKSKAKQRQQQPVDDLPVGARRTDIVPHAEAKASCSTEQCALSARSKPPSFSLISTMISEQSRLENEPYSQNRCVLTSGLLNEPDIKWADLAQKQEIAHSSGSTAPEISGDQSHERGRGKG